MRNESPDAESFDFYPLQFRFIALDQFVFPPLLSANIFRGAFGLALRRTSPDAYRKCFAPLLAQPGPSGLTNPPRPFVFRTRPLDGETILGGEVFEVGFNLLHSQSDLLPDLTAAFAEMGRLGFGPQRGRARLLESSGEPVACSLPLSAGRNVQHVRIEFLTPTELKSDNALADTPQFDILFRRARDRISNLRLLYGPGPLTTGFEALSHRASKIQLTRNETYHLQVSRRSSRTGQVHPLGGFVGVAEYVGDLSEFLPYLEIAADTGVGRQTVWGKGEIATRIL